MASVITNICERIPIALSEIDLPLMDFITTNHFAQIADSQNVPSISRLACQS
jgi:hypothetical protein